MKDEDNKNEIDMLSIAIDEFYRKKHGFISCGKSFEQLIKDLNNEQNNN